MGGVEFFLYFGGLRESFFGGFAVALELADLGEGVERARGFGVEANGFFEGVGGGGEFTFLLEGGAEHVVGFGVVGAFGDGGTHGVGGFGDVAVLPARNAERVLSLGHFRIEAQGFAEGIFGSFELVLLL